MSDLPKLSKAEFDALKEVSGGLLRKKIPDALRDRLIELKLIGQKLGGDTLTDKGKMVLHKGYRPQL